MKAMVILFFYSQWLIHVEWIPQGQTANKKYFFKIQKGFRRKMKKKRSQPWSRGQLWFHQDNISCHKSTLVTTWMANWGIKAVQHSPYNPDLALCEFFLFPRIKDRLREIRFPPTQELKETAKKYVKGLMKKDFEKNWIPGLEKTHAEVCRCERPLF